MEVDRIGVPLSYAVSKLPLPPSRWTDKDEECDISDLHGDICGLYLSTSVVFCCPSSPSSVTIGSKLFQQHKTPSLHLSNVRLSTLCTANFIRRFLLPHRLRVRSAEDFSYDGYTFSLSSDEGLYLQMPKEQWSAVGLANTTELHHHKDDFVTVRMDVTDPGYLKDGSRLCQRTMAALDRLAPCAAVLSFGGDATESDVASLRADLSTVDCAVTVMEPSVSTYNCSGKQESALLDASSLLSAVNEILETGRLPEPIPIAVPPNAEAVLHGRSSRAQDEGKRRKVLSSEGEEINIPDEFEHFLKHKELLFKAHRTLSNEKNRKLETIRNVMNELSKAAVHFVPEENFVQKLRHGVDMLLFRALTSRGNRATSTGPQDSGTEYVVSAMKGTLVPPEKMFDMFRSACEHLGAECPVFVLSATSARSPRQNAHSKELGSAFRDQHLYVICCWDPPSDVAVIVLTSQ